MCGVVLLAFSKKSMILIIEKWQYESIRFSFSNGLSLSRCPLAGDGDIHPRPARPDAANVFFKKSLLFIGDLSIQNGWMVVCE
jgi:hypothetical protein